MSTYVLVHGAWHTGAELADVAAPIKAAGHEVHTPTVAGNQPGGSKDVGLADAIQSIVDYLTENDLTDIILVGHSWGGMIITGAADKAGDRIRRLVYWNAFVPNDGEALTDMVPPHHAHVFEEVAAATPDNTLLLPFPVWRENFINDADAARAQATYDKLNPQPFRTISEKISLSKNPAEMEIGKSYLNFTEDTALPQSLPWHPRLSEKLGLFRLVQGSGSHEVLFTNPKHAAEKIMEAGRD